MFMPRHKTFNLMQKIGRCFKLIVNWRSSSDEQAAGDCPKVLAKVIVKVNLKEVALIAIYLYSYTNILMIVAILFHDAGPTCIATHN